jgi:hypothetical protein
MSMITKRFFLLAAIVVIWIVLACSLSQLVPERQSRVTSTATRTPKPTFTATSTPTRTPVPTLTPTPSNTPTNTPVPTDTPIPTDTPVPTLTPSDTPTLPPTDTPTATTRPTARPTRRPTNTPIPPPTKVPPPPFTGSIIRGYSHCGGYAGVTGQVKHGNGSPFPDVAVGVWSGTWVGAVSVSQSDGKFDVPLTNVPYGEYQVAVVKLDTCAQQDGRPTAIQCQRLSNVVKVTVTEDCNVNRVTEVGFTGP